MNTRSEMHDSTNAAAIRIVLNGEAREVQAGLSVTELLTILGLQPRMVVVEHNREILEREHYTNTEVRNGDALELVHFVGGG